jgi:hypothetical protein
MKTCTVTSNVGPPTEFQLPELGDPCSKCHERPSTKEVMIMVERPGGVAYLCDECAAPSPPPETKWTSTPPTEPGWYWRRRQIRKLQDKFPDDIYGAPYVVRVYSKGGALWDDFGEIPSDGDDFLQWWPVPIAPPRREP